MKTVFIANKKPKKNEDIGELIVYSMTTIYPYMAGTDINHVKEHAIRNITEQLQNAQIEKPLKPRKYPQPKPLSFHAKLKILFDRKYVG